MAGCFEDQDLKVMLANVELMMLKLDLIEATVSLVAVALTFSWLNIPLSESLKFET